MKTGIELIAQEREEQIQKHGFTPKIDQVYTGQELLQAAVSTLLFDETLFTYNGGSEEAADFWPEDWSFDLFCKIESKDRIEQLQIAGALIAAEIDRLQYPQIQQAKAERAKLAQELADILNGREYGEEIYVPEVKQAENNRLVVVFGSSDDLMEIAGFIYDECGAADRDVYYILKTKQGNYTFCETEELDEDTDFNSLPKITIRRGIGKGEGELGTFYWHYQTDIPHATFDIKDGGENFCRGIVFHIDDALESVKSAKPSLS